MSNSIQTRSMLIVEDDDAFRNRLAQAMSKRGFDIRTCASVAEGLEAIQHKVPEFAVIDLRLSDGSGLDVTSALQAEAPHVRTVIVTGYGDIPTAVAAARIGATDYISKPATADEIIDVLMTPKDQTPPAPEEPLPPEEARWQHIESVFNDADRSVSQAARLLSMHRRTLQRILKRHGISAASGQWGTSAR